MRITHDLPYELMRAIETRAVEEGRSLNNVVCELLRRVLAQDASREAAVPHRVSFPLVKCAHSAAPGEEMTPERIADILIDQEVSAQLFVQGQYARGH